jgi:hypothetical protein
MRGKRLIFSSFVFHEKTGAREQSPVPGVALFRYGPIFKLHNIGRPGSAAHIAEL